MCGCPQLIKPCLSKPVPFTTVPTGYPEVHDECTQQVASKCYRFSPTFLSSSDVPTKHLKAAFRSIYRSHHETAWKGRWVVNFLRHYDAISACYHEMMPCHSPRALTSLPVHQEQVSAKWGIKKSDWYRPRMAVALFPYY